MEFRLVKEPLEVEPVFTSVTLHTSSLVNFGKVYTVEHNVKVMPIGQISARSMPKFVQYWKERL
jgi:hypothetical protein